MPHGDGTRQEDVSPHRTGAEESIKAKVTSDYDLCCRQPPGGDQVVTALGFKFSPSL